MNWQSIENKWDELKLKAKEKWDKLTDQDLDEIQGNKDMLETKLRGHYGYNEDKVRSEIDDFDTTYSDEEPHKRAI